MSTVAEKARGGAAFSTADCYEDRFASASGAVFINRFDADDRLWAARVQEIEKFRLLPDDWDGEGSPAPTSELIDRAIVLARILRGNHEERPPDHVAVSVNGTICFEWQTLAEYHVIEVESPQEGEMRWVRAGTGNAEVTKLRWDF